MAAVYRLLVGAVLALLFSALFPGEVHAQTPLKVALVAADHPGRVNDVKSKLAAAGLVDVTAIDVAAGTPTLTELQQYQAILTWSNLPYANPWSLGQALADYVDQGGGVVQAVFSFNPAPPDRLDGRWRADAYEPFSSAASDRGAFLTLVPAKPHPILNGVNSFNGGGFSFHGNVQPQACADVVARWSNDRPLVAARLGPHGGRVIGLNFYPPSNGSDNSDFWVASTDGGILMANALRFAATPAPPPPTPPADGPAIALLAADEAARVTDVRCKLQHSNLFSRVDAIDVQLAPPTLATLLDYDAVLTWTSSSYNNPATLGDVLAAYIDQNRGVVQSAFSFLPASGPLLTGAWQANGYRPLAEADPTTGDGLLSIPLATDHAILAGVSIFNGGAGSHHGLPVLPDAASNVVAAWSDGQPLVAAGRAATGGRLVGLNMYPPSSDSRSDLWNSGTDGARLIANTLLYAANHFPAANAGPDQTVEAMSSIGASFTLTGTGTDIDGDSLTFNWSGGASATGHEVTVDVPPPPAPTKSETYTLVLTVTDGKGGETTDTVRLTVTDTTGPVLQSMPTGVLTAQATSSVGAAVSFGPVTATDAVDVINPTVMCSHPSGSVFPVGDTTVTCTATDTRDNTTEAKFIVRVTENSNAPTPGKAFGYGYVRDSKHHYEFAFAAIEKPSGREEGRLSFRVKSLHQVSKGRPRIDHFQSKSIDAVTFSQDSTVLFTGTGRWNGAAGYRYEVSAINKGKSNRDVVRIVIKASRGAVVAQVDGILSGGDVQIWTH